MLWDEARKRKVRERTARLAEHYRAAVDAGLQVLVSSGTAKPVGSWTRPDYIEAPTPAEPVRTPETRDRTIARLAALIPGIVRRPA